MAAMARLPLTHYSLPPTIFKPSLSSFPSYRSLSSYRSFSSSVFQILSSHSSQSQGDSNGSIVGDLLDYLNESWTQFHATSEAKRQLLAAGFHLLSENDDWNLKPGGRYFFTRNMSCIINYLVLFRQQVSSCLVST